MRKWLINDGVLCGGGWSPSSSRARAQTRGGGAAKAVAVCGVPALAGGGSERDGWDTPVSRIPYILYLLQVCDTRQKAPSHVMSLLYAVYSVYCLLRLPPNSTSSMTACATEAQQTDLCNWQATVQLCSRHSGRQGEERRWCMLHHARKRGGEGGPGGEGRRSAVSTTESRSRKQKELGEERLVD